MDPIILCTWLQMDKHGWHLRDVGRVFSAFENTLYVGGLFPAHRKVQRVNVEIWRLTPDGQEVVGGTSFQVSPSELISEMVLRPVSLQSRLYPSLYDVKLSIEGGSAYETSFETRNRR